MPTNVIGDRVEDERLLRFAGAVLVVLGVHFAVEAAIGYVHSVPASGFLARGYAVAAAVLFVAVGGTLVRTGHLRDRRVEAVAAVLSGVVLVLVTAGHLLA